MRSLETTFDYKPVIGAPLTCEFDYDKREATLSYLELSASLTINDLVDFLGIIDSVYSKIYPIGTVVELDVDMLPLAIQDAFREEPGALVTITGRKMPLSENFPDYVFDYLCRIWPFGEMPGTNPVLVTNMMIKQVHQEGMSNDWELRFSEDVLRATQLAQQQVSTAFMRSIDNLRYLEDLEREVEE